MNQKPIVHVAAAIFTKGEKVLACRRAPHKSSAGFWEFPGGKVEENETDEESLKRELYEEFGITVTVKNHLVNSFYKYEKINVNLKAYLVDHLSGDFILRDHDAINWIDSKEFGKYEFAPADIPINNYILNHGI